MASVVDRMRRRNRLQQPLRDWTSTGSFINKPPRGWLHPDERLEPAAGVHYTVRYVGCMVVQQSMKALDFETRTAVAKECICQVSEVAGLKNAAKRPKKNPKIRKLIGEEPSLMYAGSNVKLNITTESLKVTELENMKETLFVHQMPGISFASGGDPDSMDFVSYVAKDENGRACYVFECGGGLAQEVITTIGQAFELRFKRYLTNQPTPTLVSRPHCDDSDQWGNDDDYYNERVGAKSPSPTPGELPANYHSPKSNLPISDGIYSGIKSETQIGLLIDLETDLPVYDNTIKKNQENMEPVRQVSMIMYDNPNTTDCFYDNHESDHVPSMYDNHNGAGNQSNELDAFNMKPFNAVFVNQIETAAGKYPGPYQEEWFHGPLTREQTEDLLKKDGDFLVRESTKSPGQFVLSGMHSGRIRHLLLVDPEGVVRTRDKTFTSVSDLINYHMENQLPIISQESELILRRSIVHTFC